METLNKVNLSFQLGQTTFDPVDFEFNTQCKVDVSGKRVCTITLQNLL